MKWSRTATRDEVVDEIVDVGDEMAAKDEDGTIMRLPSSITIGEMIDAFIDRIYYAIRNDLVYIG